MEFPSTWFEIQPRPKDNLPEDIKGAAHWHDGAYWVYPTPGKPFKVEFDDRDTKRWYPLFLGNGGKHYSHVTLAFNRKDCKTHDLGYVLPEDDVDIEEESPRPPSPPCLETVAAIPAPGRQAQPRTTSLPTRSKAFRGPCRRTRQTGPTHEHGPTGPTARPPAREHGPPWITHPCLDRQRV